MFVDVTKSKSTFIFAKNEFKYIPIILDSKNKRQTKPKFKHINISKGRVALEV